MWLLYNLLSLVPSLRFYISPLLHRNLKIKMLYVSINSLLELVSLGFFDYLRWWL